VGLQGVPVANTTPASGQVLEFNGTDWTPSSTVNTQANQSVSVNGVVLSDDYQIAINLAVGPASTPVEVNGSLV
jgi:hypothetical protein